jgi:ATP-dependent Clp protease adapter protein ClpS
VATVLLTSSSVNAFSPAFSPATTAKTFFTQYPTWTQEGPSSTRRQPTLVKMSDNGGGAEVSKTTKKGLTTIVIDKTEEKQDQEEIPEEQWRVVLHNDEVHTFNYVIQSLCKVIGTLDRKRAFDICVVTHGQGKATITKCWKEQAMKYCLGLQRQGLTASIAPESRFTGDGGGGGDPDAGGEQ